MTTQRQLAEQYSIDISAVNRLKKKGININDKDEVRLAILSQGKMPRAWQNGCPWDEPKKESKEESSESRDYEITSLESVDLISIANDLFRSGDKMEAEKIGKIIAGLEKLVKIAVLMGDLIPKSEVVNDIKTMTSVIGSALDKLPFDLPAVIEGLEASKMQGKIKLKIKEIKSQWHDLSSEIYKENN